MKKALGRDSKNGKTGAVWRSPCEKPFKLAGFHWFGQDKTFRRLPLRPPKPLPAAVELLSWCSAGGQARFVSDTDRLSLRVKLRESFGMDCAPFASKFGPEHAAQTCVSGFDLYVGEPGAERFFAVTRFSAGAREYECQLFSRSGRKPLSFILNFPLFNCVEKLELGFGADSSVKAPPALKSDKPVVVYGTSIVHGGCASRPGSNYTNILSRRLKTPFLNMGFSGSGRGEPEVAEALSTIKNPALFVLDYEANSSLEGLRKTMPGFIDILRARHKTVPILVVSKIRFAVEALSSEPRARQPREKCKMFQRNLVKKLWANGDKNIHFMDGSTLLGENYYDCSVDGVHQTDLGFSRMAEGLAPVVKRLL